MSTASTRTATLITGALASLALTATVLPSPAGASHRNADRLARVVQVVDGDTVTLTSPTGPRRYQLLGVRAPAVTDCFGRQSRTRLRTLLPAGSKVRVISRARRSTSVVVLRRGQGVNRLVVQSGHAQATLRDGTRLARLLKAAQTRAEDAERGLWAACAQDDTDRTTPEAPERPAADPDVEPAPPAQEQEESPAAEAPPTGQATRRSTAQFQAFVENSVFTRASNDSNFGGSSNRNDFTFCSGGQYRFESESFNNGFTSGVTEAGRWRLLELTRRADLRADQGQLELVTEESNDADFDPNAAASSRTFTVTIALFDDGRIAVGDQFAQRSAASTCA
jgi:endonuclease YncB( thermonuclease family)